MMPKNKLLERLSAASRRAFKIILENKAADDDWDRDLAGLKVLGKRIIGIELETSDQMELYLEIYLWGEKVKKRRRGIWDDDMSFESYAETLASEFRTNSP